MLCDYLVQILTARVYDVAQETPLKYAPNLSARLNNLQVKFHYGITNLSAYLKLTN